MSHSNDDCCTNSVRLAILNDSPQKACDLLLHQLLDRNDPAAIALSFWSDIDATPSQLTYGELGALSAQFARRLLDANISKRIIPVLLPQSPDLYVAVLGILKSGNIYCPVLPETAHERVEFICGDIQAPIIVASPEYQRTPKGLEKWIVSSTDSRIVSQIPIVDIQLGDLAYTMYTSGSTGTPKAVMISHSSASTSIMAHDEIFSDRGAGDSMLQFANSTFDISVFEMFSTWARGMTLVSAERSVLMTRLPELISKSGVSYLELTPSMAGLLPGQDDPQMSSVRKLITIGEMITKKVISNWAGKLVNAYGPTEATLHASYLEIRSANADPSDIGLPLDTCSMAILCPDTEDILAEGETGELCIAGPQVALGYLNRDDLTKAAFIELNGFEGLVYRTGDLAEIRDGHVFFRSRKQGDTQVKINGQRIELGEIEHAIESHKDVAACAIIKHMGKIFAFVVWHSKTIHGMDFSSIGKLPLDVKPFYVEIAQIPTSAAGKRDSRALVDLADSHLLETNNTEDDDLDAAFNTSGIEQKNPQKLNAILSVVNETVQGQLRVNSKFDRFGLDSLGAIKVVMQLRQLGLFTTVFDVLDSGTVNELCNRVKLESNDPLSDTQKLSRESILDLEKLYGEGNHFSLCSAIQAAMLAASLSGSRENLYYNHIHMSLDPIVTFDEFQSAWRSLVESHQILRTGFHSNLDAALGDFTQVIYTSGSNSITNHDIEEQMLSCYLDRHKASVSLSLENLPHPPVSIEVFSTNASRHVSLMIHHALYDAWSLELMLNDLNKLFQNRTLQARPQYSTMADKLSSFVQPSSTSKHYWTEYLQDLEAPSFPALAQTYQNEAKRIRVSKNFSVSLDLLDDRCSEQSTNPQVLGQLAWSQILSWLTGETSVAFAMTISGRTLPIEGIESTLGPFIATYPFKWDVLKSSTVSNAFENIGQYNRCLTKHNMSYRDILGCFPEARAPDTLFIYQKTGVDSTEKGPLSVTNQEDRLEFAVMFTLDRHVDQLVLQIDADENLMSTEAARVLLSQIDILLVKMLDDPAQNLSSLSQFHDRLASVSRPDYSPIVAGKLDAIVEQRAISADNGNAPALQFYTTLDQSSTLSYAELDSAANVLANTFAEEALLPDDIIGICLDKSLEMYIAILAIMKLGCAYLALEPSLPDERIATIIEVTQIRHVFTDETNKSRFNSLTAVVTSDILRTSRKVDFPRRATGELAYVLMTSGTTGVPKACLVTHLNVLNNCDVLGRVYPHAGNDRMMQFTSFAFDVSVFEIFFAWSNGMCLVSAPKDLMLSNLTECIQSFQVTHVNMTATAAALIRCADIPKVKCFITSGEATTRSILKDWGNSGKYFNAYGPTETTNVVTAHQIQSPNTYTSAIGRILVNSSGYVLDEDQKVLPRLSQGELYIGGTQVIRGYMDRKRTLLSFINHPSLGRLYKTGDIVRMLDDESLLLLGRADSQVKVRGHRVELDEVTHHIQELLQIQDATTILNAGALVSFVHLAPGTVAQDIVPMLFTSLSQKLPRYMVPTYIVPLSEGLPFTTTHKLDTRRLLSIYDEAERFAHTIFDEEHDNHAWTDTAREIASIISQVAGVPLGDISPNTSIFHLGLDSISAIKISAAIAKRGLSPINVSTIMRKGSSAGIAEVIEHALSKTSEPQSIDSSNRFQQVLSKISEIENTVLQGLDFVAEEIEDLLPCTSLQEGILLETMRANDVNYINHSIISLQSEISSQKLHRACQELVDRTPTLRTCFAFTSDTNLPCLQVILRNHVVDWTTEHSSDVEASLYKWKRDVHRSTLLHRPPVKFLELIAPEAHYLVISLHHSLFDGWSLSLIHDDLENIYFGGELMPRPANRGILQAIYNGHVNFEREYERWSHTFENFSPSSLPVLSTSLDPMQTIFEDALKVPLTEINSFATKNAKSVLSLLQTSWAILLAQIVGLRDICFANVVSGRTLPIDGSEEAIMPLFNVLPIRIDLDRHSSIESLSTALHELSLSSLENPHFPLRRIRQAARLSHGEDLFDTILILQKPQNEPRTKLIKSLSDDGDSNYRLMLEFIPAPHCDKLRLRLTAKNNVVSGANLRLLAESLNHILVTTLKYPQTTIHDALIAAPVSGQSFSAPAEPLRSVDLLHSAFLRHVMDKPNAIAIEYLAKSGDLCKLTYEEVANKSQSVALQLLSSGLKHSSPVIVMMSEVPEIFIAFLGILQAGMVYTPLSTDTPEERFRYILEELQPGKILVGDSRTKTNLENMSEYLPEVCEIQDLMQPSSGSLPVVPTTASDLAYIIYTSGSTGRPKAVMLQHFAAVAAIDGSREILETDRDSKWLQFASLTFDMSIYDMSIAFSFGICLCAAPRTMMLDNLSEVINKLGATHLDLTPSVAKTLRKATLPSVRLLFCIGEKLSQSIVSEWGSKCINVYGPTEAAMACTSHKISKSSVSHNIGLPFKHTQTAIISTASNDYVPLLSLGELCLSGSQLSKGYLKDEEKTNASFFEVNGVRYYRTGDLCRMTSDHDLIFVDRKDNQAKLRGQRIELDEVSSILAICSDDFATASTLVLPSSDQQTEQLVSFVATKRGQAAPTDICTILSSDASMYDALTTKLAKNLPVYMIPGHILQVNFIPLSAAQKVDRRQLANLWKEYSSKLAEEIPDSVSEPLTEVEQMLRQTLSHVSGVQQSRIYRSTSIYHLGLDSISAIQISAALRERGQNLSVIDILQNPTLSKLSSRLQEGATLSHKVEKTDRKNSNAYEMLCRELSEHVTGTEQIYPCTPTQENMIAQFVQTGGKSYYNHLIMKLDANVDIRILKACWIKTLDTFDILRAGFVAVDTKDCQYALVIHDKGISTTLWSELHANNILSDVDDYIENLGQELLRDIRKPSLMITDVELPDGHCVMYSAHHAIYDGKSLEMILQHVWQLYQGQDPAQYESIERTVSRMWNAFHDHDAQRNTESFWNNELKKAAFTPFPNLSDRIEGAVRSHTTTEHLGGALMLSKLEEQCRNIGCSLANAAMTAWAKLISAYTGEQSVTFGGVLSGRTGMDLDDAVFPCVATVPFCCTLDGTVMEAVRVFERISTASLPHQHISLNKMRRQNSDIGFDTLFVFQNKSQSSTNTDLWNVARDIGSVEVPVSIEVIPDKSSDTIELTLTHNLNKLPESHAKVLLRQFGELLAVIVNNPGYNILDIEQKVSTDLLSIIHPQISLLDAPVKLVHEYVAYFSQRTPDAVALEFADDLEAHPRAWTFRQLEEQSNKVAQVLLHDHQLHGTAPIAVCFDKCPEAFISILAVLKTGSAFCCLDGTAPIERRKYIIEDSGSCAVLCGKSYEYELQSALDTTVIVIEDIDEMTTSREPPNVTLSETSLCYILYTSGSTGTPKGCCLSHKSVVQGLTSFQTEFRGRFDSDSRFLAFASLHFDVSILETYFSWSIGARVCAAPKDALLSDIPGAIKKFAITHLDLTPQLAMTLLPEEAESLRVFITGGEMLRAETVGHWGDSGVLFNFYGPTEATIGCTALKQVQKGARPSNIGQQFINCGSIVQSQMGVPKPALRGALGSLIISGHQVAEGYMNLAEATQKKFQYSNVLKGKTYDTGDLVRLLEVDLSFDFAGRADSQIKLRGQRIETGEIDSVLVKSSANVKEAVTLVLKHPSQQKEQLVSFIVFKGQAGRDRPVVLLSPAVSTIDQFAACKHSLSAYMVPSYIIPISRIDLTATNKVDTKKIKALYEDIGADILSTYASIHTNTVTGYVDEKVLEEVKGVLRKMTGIEQINDDTSAFELGLDSVSIIGLVRQLRSRGYSQCSVSMIMTSGDVKGLSAALSSGDTKNINSDEKVFAFIDDFKAKNMANVLQQLDLTEEAVEEIFPCTPLVEGLLVETMQRSKSLHLNSFKIQKTDLNRQKLRQSFKGLIEQTPVLRSRFVIVPDGLAQVIIRRDQVTQNSDIDFPLKSELIRLVETGDDFSIDIHHALYDGRSLDIIFDDLNSLYNHQDYRLHHPQIKPAISEICKLDLEKARQFWSSQLQDSMTRSAIRNSRTIHDFDMTTSLATSDLEMFARDQACAPNVVIQTAWALLLHQILDGNSIFGLVVSGRNMSLEGIDETVYPTFNTLPVYVDTTSAQSLSEITKALQQSFGKAIDFEHTPYREIKKALSVQSDTALMDTVLVYQKENRRRADDHDSSLEFVDKANGSSGFAVALDVTAIEHGCLKLAMKVEDVGLDPKLATTLFEQVLSAILSGKDLQEVRLLLRSLEPIQVQQRSFQNAISTQAGAADSLLGQSEEGQKILSVVSELAPGSNEDQLLSKSFFSLGLDSIDIVKLSARLRQKHKFAFSVNDILQNSSIASLVALHKSRISPDSIKSASLLTQEFSSKAAAILSTKFSYEDIMPVSPIQEGMLTMSRSHEDGLYLNHSLLRLATDVGVDQMINAWRQLIDENDILRTSFEAVDGQALPIPCNYVQIIHSKKKHCTISTEIVKEDSLKASFERFKKGSLAQLQKKTTIPFFLHIFETESANYLALSLHHALYDGASLDMLYHDLQDLVRGNTVLESRPPYSVLLEHVLQSVPARADLFWTTYLKTCQPRFRTFKSSMISAKLERNSKVDLSKARNISQRLGISLQSMMQCCFAKVVAELLEFPDVLFGTIQSGRSFAPEADRIIGPCMNTVPLRASIQRSTSFQSLATELHAMNIEMSEYVHTSLRRIQKLVSKGPLFETLFVYQNSTEGQQELNIWKPIFEDSAVEFPLAVECNVGLKSLGWTVATHAGFLPDDYDLIKRLDDILQTFVESPEQPMMDHKSKVFTAADAAAEDSILDKDSTETKSSPIGEEEIIIAKTLSQMLGSEVDSIGRDTSIFSLGLDSISVIELSKTLRKQNIKISVGDILRNPTIKDMHRVISATSITLNSQNDIEAARTQELLDTAASHPYITTLPDDHKSKIDLFEDVRPATASQVYFFSAWRQLKARRFMSNFVFDLSTDRSIQTMQECWKQLCKDHSILRTTFTQSADEASLLQIVHKESQSEMSVFESQNAEAEQAIQEFLRSESFICPDLTIPPAFLTAVVTSTSRVLLVLSIHHSLYDANSLSMLIEMLQRGSTSGLTSYINFSKKINNYVADSEKYWQGYLQGAKPFHLPGRNEPITKRVLRSLGLSKEDTSQLDFYSSGKSRSASELTRMSGEYGVTIQSILLTAMAKCLAKIAKQDDALLGMYSSGRSLDVVEIEHVFGPTVNIVPVRFDDVRARSLRALAEATHKSLIAMNGFVQQTPIDLIHRATGWQDTIGGLVDVTVNILPRRMTNNNESVVPSGLTDYGRLSTQSIELIRQRYSESFIRSTIDEFTGTDAVRPTLDIEVEIVDHCVNFGIFCATCTLDEQGAQDLVDDIWSTIVNKK